jgi:SPFH domain/Band 7 family protein
MLDSALGWIGQVAEWVGKFIPRWERLDVTYEAIKIVRGRWEWKGWRPRWLEQIVVVCKPDRIHWWWPATTLWFEHPVVRQRLNLKSQVITLHDDTQVLVAGLIVFKVRDIQKLLTQTYGIDECIGDIALAAMHEAILSFKTWADLKEAQQNGALNKCLKSEATQELSEYGVTILKAVLTDLARCRVFKLVQSTSQD